MKKLSVVIFALVSALSSGAAMANADLAKAKNCLSCHAADKKLVGPSYADIAKKHAGDKGAVDKLAQRIREGVKAGETSWGPVPMPANSQVSEAEAKTLATWVLAGGK
jgi:cytochrome c